VKIEPEDLLACVLCMTEAQKASFCELMDPVQTMPDLGPGVQGIPSPPDENKKPAPVRGLGVQGPRPGAVGPGMVGWVLGGWREDRNACMGAQSSPVLRPPSAIDSPDTPSKLMDRWDLARARWQRTFGESPIPMIRIPLAASATALDTIEGMLYDKAVKNQDPECCPCGCGYVIGCVGY
jgi:hypothetical protein